MSGLRVLLPAQSTCVWLAILITTLATLVLAPGDVLMAAYVRGRIAMSRWNPGTEAATALAHGVHAGRSDNPGRRSAPGRGAGR